MKRLLICTLLLICVLPACGQSTDNSSGDILVLNCTDAPVCSIKISWENETLAGQNADGTTLERYEYLTLDMDKAPATVTACDIEGTELASCTIPKQTQGRWSVHLICDAAGNYVMEAKEVDGSDPNSAFVAGTEQTWRGVVNEQCMDQVRAVDSRWRFLVPSRAAIGIETETGMGNSFWESEYYDFPDNVSLGDYVEVESAIEKSSGLLVATDITVLKNIQISIDDRSVAMCKQCSCFFVKV